MRVMHSRVYACKTQGRTLSHDIELYRPDLRRSAPVLHCMVVRLASRTFRHQPICSESRLYRRHCFIRLFVYFYDSVSSLTIEDITSLREYNLVTSTDSKRGQWRSKVGAGPWARVPTWLPLPPPSDGPACTTRLAHPIDVKETFNIEFKKT